MAAMRKHKPLCTITRPELYSMPPLRECEASCRLDGETRVIEPDKKEEPMRARELAAEAKKQVKPEVKKLRDFLLKTESTTLYLSRREVGAILEELNALKDKNERAAKMLRRHAKKAMELAGEES